MKKVREGDPPHTHTHIHILVVLKVSELLCAVRKEMNVKDVYVQKPDRVLSF